MVCPYQDENARDPAVQAARRIGIRLGLNELRDPCLGPAREAH
jgi:hypothetical protein